MSDLNDPALASLLSHYVDHAGPNRETWLDRVMGGPELSRRHGLLIADGWLEQNTGQFPRLAANEVPGCYRATAMGRAALKQVGR